MRDLKNIDRLFQENLKDFEVSPPTKVWNAIEKQLVKPSKKRLIPFWVKISSIAALFALLFSVGTIYLLPTSNLTKNILPKKTDTPKIIDNKDIENSTTIATKIPKAEINSPIEIDNTNNFKNLIIINKVLIEKLTNKVCNINWGAKPYRTRDIMKSIADTSNFKILKWKPK